MDAASARPSGRVLLGALALLLLAGSAAAQQPAVEVRLQPERLGVEDLARLTVTLVGGAGQVAGPELGPLDNFQVVSGPSTENHFSWINGVATSSVRFTYLLQPERVGQASVGAVKVQVGDVTLSSSPITAEVVPGSLAPPRRGRQVPPSGRDPFADLFDPFGDPFGRREPQRASLNLRQLVSDQKVLVGEPIVVSVVLDTTVTGIEGFEWVTPPTYPGCWAQRVELPEQISPEVVESDGGRFHRYVVARHVLVPLKAGPLSIPAAKARIGVRARSVFAPLQVEERSTEPLEATVSDRPAAPEGFAGAVGDLEYSVKLVPSAIAEGESAVLTIKLEGRGNLPLVEAPAAWPSCASCESYPPEEDSRVVVDSSGIHGSRVWRMTLVPRQSGELRLEPVTLAVLNPATGQYRRQTLGPLALSVAAPEPTPTPATPAALPTGAVEEAESAAGREAARGPVPPWLLLAVGLLGGVLAGVVATWIGLRRGSDGIRRRSGEQSPAERARDLQTSLEAWWLEARDRATEGTREEMDRLRRELDAVRFAPGRADHSQTITDLEARLRILMRRA